MIYLRRVTNCILINENKVLLLKKPRHGWYAMPGGKMELGESIKESVMREYREETGLHLISPELKGAFTITTHDEKKQVDEEWMMFTFVCRNFSGEMVDYCDEGELEWVPINEVSNKPMAEGDRHIHSQLFKYNELVYGVFTYTPDDRLIDFRLDPLIS
ncbi:NUDIX hydrolase [Radiobacillus sp. PE A8.2]|uniref:NUDIX hydrolase n=1 Tax=Radiobacillus sp. PE A8.2 TaxID=3380349 RepID=UPI00388D5471